SDLAALLREAREAVRAGEATQDDLRRALAVVNLHRVPLARRVVRRAGAGAGARGNLGGWVVALSDVEPALADAVQALGELLAIPDITTGRQALDFLLDTWERKPTAGVEVLRGHLAAAYRYVLDDMDAEDLPVGAWVEARAQAQLYGHREWHPIGPTLVVDDVQSPLIREFLPTDRIAVASTHLGDTKAQVRRVARALDVALLSAEVEVEPGERTNEPPWGSRLRQLTATLSQLEDRPSLHDIALHNALSLRVGGRCHAIQAYVEGVDNQSTTLLLVGHPADFAVQAAEQLVEHFQLGQRGQEVPRLTGALFALDDESAFRRHLKLLADGLGVEPATTQSGISHKPPTQDSSADEDTDVGADAGEKAPDPVSGGGDESVAAPPSSSGLPGPHAGGADARPGRRAAPEPFGGSKSRPGDRQDAGKPARPNGHRDRDAAGGSRTRPPTPGNRAADHVRMLVMSRGSHDMGTGDAASVRGNPRDDRRARQAVLRYEKQHGRRAEKMPDRQRGFDVRSVDDAGRERRIEAKGVQGRFEEDASVALTAPQANDALWNDDERVEYWLYVVDSTETERPRVFPIPWVRDPARLRYGFYAYAWSDAAEHPAEAPAEGLVAPSSDAPEPLDPGDLVGDPDHAGDGRPT
ncbi:MAG: hypothetical protein OXQ28_12715, partial [Acidobacteriota bacterium]|nr:hypothetical protein [Acidobacteriota bacterium]